jgi:hypothetical protein
MPMLAKVTVPPEQRRAFVRAVTGLSLDDVTIVDNEGEPDHVSLEIANRLNDRAATKRAAAVVDAAGDAAGRPFDVVVGDAQWRLLRLAR